jgi:hypothetical protein
MPDYEQILCDKLVDAGYPEPEQEYRFDKVRKWRIDLAYPPLRIGIEVEGGAFSAPVKCHNCGALVMQRTKTGKMVVVRAGGRHNRGVGLENDAEKYNQAAIDNWMILRVTPTMIKDGRAVDVIGNAIAKRNIEALEL